jgi:hypothetical protein
VTTTMNWWRRLAQNRMIDVGVMVLLITSVIRLAATLPTRWFDFDFNHFYVAGRLLLAGENPYTTSLGPLSRELGFVYAKNIPTAGYPPPFLWLFAGLANLEPRTAFAIWVALQAVSLGVILWITRRLVGGRLSPRGWRFVCAGAVMSQTVYSHFYFSQVQLMLAALVLAAYAWHRKGKNTAACLAITAAGAAKLYPFALLPWLIWRGGVFARTRVRLVVWSAALLTTIVLLTGPGMWADFLRFGTRVSVEEQIARNYHFSAPGMLINLGYAASNFAPSGAAAHGWWLLGVACGVGVIGMTYVVSLQYDRDPEAQFCLLTLAMLAVTLSTQGSYFVWLIFPVAVAVARVAANFSASRATCLALAIIAVNNLAPLEGAFLDRHLYLKIALNNIPLYGLLILGSLFWSELRHR